MTGRRRWSSSMCKTTSPIPRAASTSARASGSCRWSTGRSSGGLVAGALVVYTQDWHPPETPHFQSGGGVWPEHCVQHTWGAQLHPNLRVAGEVVRKGQGGEDGYSGFTVRDPVTGEEATTPLEGLLRRRGVGRVVVVGLATDYCVKETALDAVRLGFDTVVLGGLVRAVDLQPGDGQGALAAMRAAGARIEPPA